MDTGEATAESQGPPLAILNNLELHSSADRLCDTKGSAKRLHTNRLLGSLPVLEAGLERVGGNGDGGFGVVGRGSNAVTESIVDARGGGGRGCVGDVREGGSVGVGGDDAHGLRHFGGCEYGRDGRR